jgi:hypothetical protein
MAGEEVMSATSWQRTDFAHGNQNNLLIINQAQKTNEPYFLWEREDRVVYISELANMEVEKLKQLRDDVSVYIEELDQSIRTSRDTLVILTDAQPSAIDRERLLIRRLSTKKRYVKTIALEASRLIKNHNATLNNSIGKPKKKAATNAQKGHDLQKIEQIFNKNKTAALYQILRDKMGEEFINELNSEAILTAIKWLKEWAAQTSVDQALVAHVIKHQTKALSNKQS